MSYAFTVSREKFNERDLDKQIIRHLILKHKARINHLQKLEDYYEGRHSILGDSSRDNKLVCNHAKDIADTASAYFIGNPVAYKSDIDITQLTDALEVAGADKADGDNGLDLSIYGRAYEYIYAREGEARTELQIKNLDPKNTFVVYDDTIEGKELFAVYYYARVDASDRFKTTYVATVVTQNYVYCLNIQDTDDNQQFIEAGRQHFMGEVPIIEYHNNKFGFGDYELQVPLIDAYNALMSDRITDKEQFIDAILALYGALLSDEDDDQAESARKRLNRDKLLELPADAKAEYLTRTFDENGVEILRKALEQDIHKFSHIPCMSDENFGGNVSGVAMEFKLLGMENLTKIKTRYYREGLQKRIRIFANFLEKRAIHIDYANITPIFTRALPKNLLEISQYVTNLWGKVSKKTLLSQVPFVDDPDEELKVVQQEEEESIKKQQAIFGNSANTSPDFYDEDGQIQGEDDEDDNDDLDNDDRDDQNESKKDRKNKGNKKKRKKKRVEDNNEA